MLVRSACLVIWGSCSKLEVALQHLVEKSMYSYPVGVGQVIVKIM